MAAIVAAALVGGAVALATQQLRLTSRTSAATRTALIGQVQQQETVDGGLVRTQQALKQTVAERRGAALSTTRQGLAAAAAVASLEEQTAGVAVSGAGITVTVADAAAADAQTGRVQDRDLQSVVNALWGSGAEAIAVDGERLGPGTAIREAGQAVLVDFHPVTSPYVVAAIGDGNRLQTGFADSDAGARLQALQQIEGITSSVASVRSLHLAAANTPVPEYAGPLQPKASP